MFNRKPLILLISAYFMVSILSALPVIAAGASPSENGWLFRKEITIHQAMIDSDLTNFPLLVSFSSDSDLASRAQSDGSDILFTNANDIMPNVVSKLVCLYRLFHTIYG